MGQKSSIDRLPEAVRTAIQDEINAGRLTLDEILDRIRDEFGDEHLPSRSALGRYRKRFEEQVADLKESRELASIYADRLGRDPNSDVGKFTLEILRTLAYRAGADMLDFSKEGTLEPKQMAHLARMMKYIEDAGRLSTEREAKLRAAAREQAAEAAQEVARGQGLPDDVVDQIYHQVLGVET